jgi:hypothetical protein
MPPPGILNATRNCQNRSTGDGTDPPRNAIAKNGLEPHQRPSRVGDLVEPVAKTLSNVANGRELIERHGGEFAVGRFQQDFVAVDLIVGIAAEVHSVPTPLDADDSARRLGGPTLLSHGDDVFNLDTVANLQFVKLGSDLAVAGSHGTALDGTL